MKKLLDDAFNSSKAYHEAWLAPKKAAKKKTATGTAKSAGKSKADEKAPAE